MIFRDNFFVFNFSKNVFAMKVIENNQSQLAWADPEKGQEVQTPPPGKSQVAIGFLRNSGTYTHRKAIGPIVSNCFSGEVQTALYEIS